METNKIAIVSLTDLDNVDLELINTTERVFTIEYSTNEDLMCKIWDTLTDACVWPCFVYLNIGGTTYKIETTPLHYCFAKGRVDELQLIEMLLTPENIVSTIPVDTTTRARLIYDIKSEIISSGDVLTVATEIESEIGMAPTQINIGNTRIRYHTEDATKYVNTEITIDDYIKKHSF